MITLLYDSTLAGFLTCIFEAYERRIKTYRIRQEENYPGDMFGDSIIVSTCNIKAGRVWKGLKLRITRTGQDYLYCAFLSELPDREDMMQAFITHIFSTAKNAEQDFSNETVLRIQRVSKQVHRERHRMKAFIRFQLTGDGIYYAAISPDFNVIPLITKHFKDRYADQRWLIYDQRRNYGMYYDGTNVEMVTFDERPGEVSGEKTGAALWHEKEEIYQRLWQDYFTSVNIASRKNNRLHLRHVPRRYWRWLTEKFVVPG